jgi:Protein of unknown function, DUF547
MRMKSILKIITLAFAAVLFSAGLSANAAAFDHSHAAWDALVRKHVVLLDGGKASKVNYLAFGKDRGALKTYLDSLSAVSAAEFKGWSKPQQMAFLINAYNAFTVELILQNYPVKSIKDIGGIFDNRWKRQFFKLFGEDFYLDRIEHATLRKPGAYDEVRVHFALNCASIGCPMLREEAFIADQLDRQLEEQTQRFLSDRSRNRYADGKLEVSMIFNWFKDDWASGYKGFDGKTPPITSREQWFARYARLLADAPADQAKIAAGKVAIAFIDYDWGLNGAN